MSGCQSNRNGWEFNEHEFKHHEKKEECCCKESMKKALELLSSRRLKGIDFDHFVFIGEKFLVGANIRTDFAGNDNINNPSNLGVPFKGLDICNCDLISLGTTSNIFYPIPNNTPSDVEIPSFSLNHMSLCDLQAVVFNYEHNPSKDLEDELSELLDEFHKKCQLKCEDCCCNKGIFNAIFNKFNSNNLINFTAGWLAATNAKVLGKIDNVLVLSSTAPSTHRIYLVCLDAIGFIGY
ncbi:CotA family spore coat protein [Romboutsia lituseburensis]|uniref:CotA family spore coat protein n=1 Tax=Romboutsia lituseburensis TaxID=1537 RepID=UPI00215AE451|nr:CotA family spore coat protein [Romboutsia lituseburensis]MCR8744518.1 hypothetical protein [Romboutsia lituseburensis]